MRIWIEKYFVDFKSARMEEFLRLFLVSLKNIRLFIKPEEDKAAYNSCVSDFRRLSVLLEKIYQKKKVKNNE